MKALTEIPPTLKFEESTLRAAASVLHRRLIGQGLSPQAAAILNVWPIAKSEAPNRGLFFWLATANTKPQKNPRRSGGHWNVEMKSTH
jgi:hypothetical protein